MIRHLFFIVVLAGCLSADLPPVKTYKTVNEYQSDIYFGNGILTTFSEADNELYTTLQPAILHDIYNGDKKRMERCHSQNSTTCTLNSKVKGLLR